MGRSLLKWRKRNKTNYINVETIVLVEFFQENREMKKEEMIFLTILRKANLLKNFSHLLQYRHSETPRMMLILLRIMHHPIIQLLRIKHHPRIQLATLRVIHNAFIA